jgi:hypothetical protein
VGEVLVRVEVLLHQEDLQGLILDQVVVVVEMVVVLVVLDLLFCQFQP